MSVYIAAIILAFNKDIGSDTFTEHISHIMLWSSLRPRAQV